MCSSISEYFVAPASGVAPLNLFIEGGMVYQIAIEIGTHTNVNFTCVSSHSGRYIACKQMQSKYAELFVDGNLTLLKAIHTYKPANGKQYKVLVRELLRNLLKHSLTKDQVGSLKVSEHTINWELQQGRFSPQCFFLAYAVCVFATDGFPRR